MTGRPEGLHYDAADALVLGCTIRERAPHLIPSIEEFLRRIGRPSGPADEACCGSLDVEAGRALPSRVKAGVVADPVCLEQYDAEFLGAAGDAAPRSLRVRSRRSTTTRPTGS